LEVNKETHPQPSLIVKEIGFVDLIGSRDRLIVKKFDFLDLNVS